MYKAENFSWHEKREIGTSVDKLNQLKPKDSKLTVIKIVYNKDNYKMALCRCSCGKIKEVDCFLFVKSKTKSCGCLRRENQIKVTKYSGASKTKEYQSWHNMISRCYDPKRKGYELYGGRGITVCKRWRSYNNFYKDMKQTDPEKFVLDRIDPNGNYEPSNCRWLSKSESSRNRRCVVNYFLDGHFCTLAEHARRLNIGVATVRGRVKNGWPKDNIITYKKYSWKEVILMTKGFKR